MGFFANLFGKSKAKEIARRKATEEEEMLRDVIDFIRINAEGDDGDPEYQFKYGLMFYTGRGPGGRGVFPKDTSQAHFWFRKAADQGNLDAITMLGNISHEEGNIRSTLKYYRKAAEGGHAAACENLGMLYGLGKDVPKNNSEAHRWFLHGAKIGSPFCQYIVGLHYKSGVGVSENIEIAYQWFFKAAAQGEPHAQYEIGKLYELGGDDIATAREWYAKAAAQGHDEARAKLKSLK